MAEPTGDVLDCVLEHLTMRVKRIFALLGSNLKFDSCWYNDAWAINHMLTSEDEIWRRITREEKIAQAISFLNEWAVEAPEFP